VNNKIKMKKILLAITAALSVSAAGYAQEEPQKVVVVERDNDFRDRMMFGIKGGANYSNVYDSEGEDFNADAKFGFVGGVFLAVPIGSFLGIQPEVLYSQKGFKAVGRILGSSYEFTRTTSYIDVPVFVAIKPSSMFTILVGPQYSYLVSQKDEFVSSTMSTAQMQEFENDNLRKNTLSLAGGIDINVRHSVIGLRAGWDITNNNGNGTSTTPRYKNTWLQATIGFRF
jgi:hypothetical protein